PRARPGAEKYRSPNSRRHGLRHRRRDRRGQDDAGEFAAAALRAGGRRRAHRRCRCEKNAAPPPGGRHRLRVAGNISFLRLGAREHSARRGQRRSRAGRGSGAHGPASADGALVQRRLRDHHRRARRAPLGRAETAHGAGPRGDQKPADPDPRRRLFQRRRRDGRRNSPRAARVHARADNPADLAPDVHRARGRSDYLFKKRRDRRARQPRRAARPARRLQRALPAPESGAPGRIIAARGRAAVSEEIHHEDEILGKAYDARLMARVLRYLKPYWKLLAVSLIFLLLQTGGQLLGPYITKVAIDRYIAGRDVHGLDLMALAYLGVVLFSFIVLFIQTYTTQYTGQRAMHDLRMEIFSHLQKQDMAYFDRHAVGRLMTRTINDVETLNELFSTGVVGLLGDVSIVFGIAAMMLWLDWKLALVCLAAFPAILYISRFYRRRAREVYRESRLILGRLNAGLAENLAGAATIQAFGQEEKMYGRFREVNLNYRDVLLRSI